MDTPRHVLTKLRAIGFALLPFLMSLDATGSRAWAEDMAASCLNPSELARSVVSIVRYFDQPRHEAGDEIVGERATAWFYASPRFLVTAAHFARDLPDHDWAEAELRQTARDGEPDTTVRVHLRVIAQGQPPGLRADVAERNPASTDDVAIVELREPFPNAQVLDVRTEPPATDATVLVLGYPHGRMQAAHGIVREAGSRSGKFAGLTLLEVQGDNRLLLDSGTSGAPVLDCRQGRVVAVLTGLLTGPHLPFLPSGRSVVPTPWGSPTNTAAPAATVLNLMNRLP